MTFALLNRDGTFRAWVEDPDPSKVRPGCLVPQSVDKTPEARAGFVVEEGEPVVSVGVARKTWRLVEAPQAPAMLPALAFVDRITPEEWERIEALAAGSVEIRAALRRLRHAQEVDLLDPLLSVLFGAAAQAGAIDSGRIPEILAPA